MMTTTAYETPDVTSTQWVQDAFSAFGRIAFAIETDTVAHGYLERVRVSLRAWTDQYRATVDGHDHTPGAADAMANTAYERANNRWMHFTKSR